MNRVKTDICIVIPTLNSSKYIENNIRSLYSFMNLYFTDYSILIVNDCSTDNTMEVLLKLKREMNTLFIIDIKTKAYQRLATSLGYMYANAKYVLTLDDDFQYKLSDITVLYDKLVNLQNGILLISAFYNYKAKVSNYSLFRRFVLIIFNYILFPGYRKSKYFSSFKLYNKDELDKLKVHNIFYFWEIPSEKISTLKIEKEQKKLIRQSNYKFINYWKVFNHVFVKSILKILIPLIIIFIVILKSVLLTGILTLLCLALYLFLQQDKYYYRNFKDYEIY